MRATKNDWAWTDAPVSPNTPHNAAQHTATHHSSRPTAVRNGYIKGFIQNGSSHRNSPSASPSRVALGGRESQEFCCWLLGGSHWKGARGRRVFATKREGLSQMPRATEDVQSAHGGWGAVKQLQIPRTKTDRTHVGGQVGNYLGRHLRVCTGRMHVSPSKQDTQPYQAAYMVGTHRTVHSTTWRRASVGGNSSSKELVFLARHWGEARFRLPFEACTHAHGSTATSGRRLKG